MLNRAQVTRWIALLALIVLAGCLALAAYQTRHWPQISDSVLMHYVVFLLRHGMHPYTQIVDPNMPGSYAVDWLARTVLGGSAGSWRIFDWLLTASAGAAMVFSVREMTAERHCPGAAVFTGLWAACIFALWHVGDGVAQAAQRDYTLAVLLLIGYACIARALRRGSRILLLFFAAGCCAGIAATLKPQVVLLPVVLLLLPGRCRQRSRVAAAAVAGLLAPLLAISAWLASMGSLGAFLATARGLMAYHASLARHSALFLVAHACPALLLPMFLVLGLLVVRRAVWTSFPAPVCMAGLAFGYVSFCIQGKAYPYHRYPLIAVLLLWFAVEAARVLGRPDRARWALAPVCIVLAYGVLWLAPSSTARALRYQWQSPPSLSALQADLTRLAGPAGIDTLQRQVQCMDTMAGCITVLDRMHLIQSTGFLYDCYFFAPGSSPVKNEERARFLSLILRNPPRIFVVTSQWCLNLPDGYIRLGQWPAFHSFLASHYALWTQRSPEGASGRYIATWPFGYQIYVSKGTALP